MYAIRNISEQQPIQIIHPLATGVKMRRAHAACHIVYESDLSVCKQQRNSKLETKKDRRSFTHWDDALIWWSQLNGSENVIAQGMPWKVERSCDAHKWYVGVWSAKTQRRRSAACVWTTTTGAIDFLIHGGSIDARFFFSLNGAPIFCLLIHILHLSMNAISTSVAVNVLNDAFLRQKRGKEQQRIKTIYWHCSDFNILIEFQQINSMIRNRGEQEGTAIRVHSMMLPFPQNKVHESGKFGIFFAPNGKIHVTWRWR